MNQYTDKEIKERLLEADYPSDEQFLSGVIERIRSLGPEATALFEQWMEKRVSPKFELAGISSNYLRLHHKMKDVALIIAFDWLTKEPDEASRLLKKPVISHT